ncbi:retrovirus-related pol polyprotein from transposon TNT 1-94 [Tanacetum coccineum]
MAFEQFSLGPGPKLMTPETISSGLVQNIPSPTPYVAPTKNDWETLFQPMFDEYLNPPLCVDLQVPVVIASESIVLIGTPSSTTIDQDAPSTSSSQTNQETRSPIIPLGVEEADHDIEVVIPNNVHPVNQPPKHINKWTKDHPIDNVIGDPSRPVSTRHQLQDEALFCYFDAFLSFGEHNSYKEALTESCWIKAMQEELNEFERLVVWELVPRLDRVMIITLKWIYKVKLDERVGLQISQSPKGIFLNQSKYALESLKKYGMETCDPVDNPMAKPTENHLHAVKQIFRYLRGTINIGLWYSKDSCIALTSFADVDYVGCQDTRKCTSGSMQLLGNRLLGMRSMSPETLKKLADEEEEIINPQETQQVVTRDEKWAPFTKSVKISSTNVRLETSVQHKEETFQVVIDTIKKVKDSESYEFLLSNKKCIVDVEVFRKILDICPRVEGEEFTEVQDDDAALTFLIDLGYKGPLHKYTNMYVDHMHQAWRTLVAIINKCLSGTTASNDQLRKFRIDILWGLLYRENVDYPELIWEDFAFQIDYRKERKSRRETIPFPQFTKVIINHFLSQHKSLSKLQFQHYHTIKDDGIVSRLKLVRIGEAYQEYGLPIPDMMLNDKIN